MGIRYRKSIKIAKGVKLNFSKSGVSTTFGIPGFSYTVGKKGTYLNAGIPGTGLSYRTKVGGSTSGNRSGGNSAIAKDAIKAQNAELVQEYNSHVEEIINLYGQVQELETLSAYKNRLAQLRVKKYQREEIGEEMPSAEKLGAALEKQAKEIFTTAIPWKKAQINRQREEYVEKYFALRFSDQMKKWEERRSAFLMRQDAEEKRENEKFLSEYEEERVALEAAINGDECYVDLAIQNWLTSVELPLDFAVDFQYFSDKKLLALDIDLPEIEDLPQEKAKQLASGEMKIVPKSRKDLNADYVECVLGIAAFFASHTGNVSPLIDRILVSGYTQRRNAKTGELQDDYVYSVVFSRASFNEAKLREKNAKEFCMSFTNRCNILASGVMKVIVPYASDDIQ